MSGNKSSASIVYMVEVMKMTTLLTLLNPNRYQLLQKNTQSLGYTLLNTMDENALRDALDHAAPTAALVEAALPWRDVCSLLEMLREHRIPVIFLTDHPESAPHLERLYRDAACMVLSGPLTAERLKKAVAELLARSSQLLICGRLCLDTDTHEATIGGNSIPLTAQEYALLYELMLNPEDTVSREELLTRAWGYQSMGETRTVDVHVQRLRRKLGAAAIETVYRKGYRLKTA